MGARLPRDPSHFNNTLLPTPLFCAAQWSTKGVCGSPLGLAKKLIDKGLEDQSKDNMSAIVVTFPGAPPFAGGELAASAEGGAPGAAAAAAAAPFSSAAAAT